MKRILMMALALIMVLGLAACATPSATTAEPAEAAESTTTEAATTEEAAPAVEDDYVVGYLCSNFNDTGQVFIKDGAKAKAEELGMVFLEADAQEDVIKQQDQAKAFIVEKVDVLVCIPVSTDAVQPIIDDAKAAGIPLVFVNRNPFGESEPPDGCYYIGSEEIVAGQKEGEYLIELLGDQKDASIFILEGKLDNEAAIKRTKGAKETLEAAGFSIKAIEVGNWQRDQAVTITENWLTAYAGEMTAIVANNDEMALGAVEALQKANRPDVIVLGVDFTPDAKSAIQEGKMAGSVRQDLSGQGAGGIQVAFNLLTTGSADKTTWIPFVLITAAEVDMY